MRYKLDVDGYVISVAFGCYLNGGAEYTGTVPLGYISLDDWATYSCIQAYYIDENGNLVLDQERLAECRRKEAQDKIDNTPLLRKDLYGSEEVLDSQYLKNSATGKVVTLEDAKTIAPRVKITGIPNYGYSKLSIYTQGRNMMPCSATSGKVSGVTFTHNTSVAVNGTATADIEYTVSGSETNTTPLFTLKAGENYYLNLGGFDCELRYYDGETTLQQYVGASGLLNLGQDIAVTQVILKIARGTTVNSTFYPQLEYGTAYTTYESHKRKVVTIDIGEAVQNIPSVVLYPCDSLYPNYSTVAVEYILVENGVVYACVGGTEKIIGAGNVGMYSGYDTVYALQDVTLEIEYSTNVIDVNSLEFLQGKATTTNKFKILEDGSIEAHNGKFSGEVTGSSFVTTGTVTKYAKDYTEADRDRANSITIGNIEPTEADYEKLDLNGDGIINMQDVMMISRFLQGNLESVTFDTSIRISSGNEKEIVKLQDVSIGATSVRAKNIHATSQMFSKTYRVYDTETGTWYSGKSGEFTTADGKTITVVGGLITHISDV